VLAGRIGRIALLPLIAVLGLLAACTSSSPAEQLPAASDLLAKSAAAMRTVKTAAIDIQVDQALTSIPVRRATGTLTAAGAAKGTATLAQGSALAEFEFVIVGGDLYLKGPTGAYRKVSLVFAASIYDPSAILNPEKGVARLLSTTADAKTEAKESVNGVDTYRVRANLDQQAVAALVPGITGKVSGLLWLDASTSRLVKAQLDVPTGNGSATAPATVTFSDYDAPVTITPPS
jgi:lipoprotein LprG